MLKSKIIIVALVAVLFLATDACAPKATPTIAPTLVEVAPTPRSPVMEAWEEKWESWVSVARKEGSVTVYSSIRPEAQKALTHGFTQKYGIQVEFTLGRGAELTQKIFAERRAGLAVADMFIGGAETIILVVKPAGILEPLEQVPILPEVANPEVWFGGGHRWLDREHCALSFLAFPDLTVFINTSLVKPEEVKSYQDLLNPKWKGKITMNDPTVSGTGSKWFNTVGASITGWDYMRNLAKQEPLIIRDQRLQVEWLAHGKYPVAIRALKDVVKEFKEAGAPLKTLNMAEGEYLTSGSGIVTLIKGAPHPNAAKVFINWILTRDVQTLYSKATGYQSARLDVPTGFLEPLVVRVPGVKYINADDEDSYIKAPEYHKLAVEIFGPLIK